MPPRTTPPLTYRAAVLAVLTAGPAHGMEIQRRIAAAGMHCAISGIYPQLRALVAEGLAESTPGPPHTPSGGGIPSPVYALTPDGRREARAQRKRVMALLGA